MGINFSGIKDQINIVLDELFTDAALIRSITYRLYTGQSFSSGAGHTVNTYTNSTVSAIRITHTDKSVAIFSGELQAGDIVYIIRASEAPAGMSLKDLIVDSGETLKVKKINDASGCAWFISVEGE